MKKICSFCGHGGISYSIEVQEKVKDTIEALITDGVDTFLLGGYGNFDIMAARTVYNLKSKYPHIKSILVVPYLNRTYNTDYYDETEYPAIENVPMRFAIVKRNEWMVNKADVVIAYVEHDWGGAYKTYDYAIKKKKQLINISIIP